MKYFYSVAVCLKIHKLVEINLLHYLFKLLSTLLVKKAIIASDLLMLLTVATA